MIKILLSTRTSHHFNCKTCIKKKEEIFYSPIVSFRLLDSNTHFAPSDEDHIPQLVYLPVFVMTCILLNVVSK